jgi:hypothetical protein
VVQVGPIVPIDTPIIVLGHVFIGELDPHCGSLTHSCFILLMPTCRAEVRTYLRREFSWS